MSKSRTGAPRRVAAGLLAGALAVAGFALAPPAGAVDDVSADRVAGTTRYGTAAAVAGQDEFQGSTVAILATGENFPDALAASGLAGVNAPAPIVLTQTDTYSQEARDALNSFTNVTTVIIVGGTAAISQTVQDEVEADGFTVTRVAGVDRFATAADIAGEIGAGNVGSIGGLQTAFIANGLNFPDALAGGPLSYAGTLPILLVTPDSVPAATSAALTSLGIEQVVILGGTAAVSNGVEAELETATGNDAIRVAGVNRFGTAADVGEFAVDNAEFGWAPTEVLLANGLNFPDALAGGPFGGERDAPIILTASLPQESADFLDLHSDTITDVTALGGTAAVSEDDLSAAETAAEETSNDDTTPTNQTATTRPELVSASIVETRTQAAATATRPTGTYVLYCYDEAITGGGTAGIQVTINPNMFHVFDSNGTRYTAPDGAYTPFAGQTFTSGVSTADNKCAEVVFGAPLTTAAGAANLTLATSQRGAVAGAGGFATDSNIEGDAPLTPSGATAAAAGVTAAPDLLTVGNFRAGATGDVTAVDFTFDAPANALGGGGGYHLVDLNGVTYNCQGPTDTTTASGQASPGGNGTTVHTVNCVEAGANPAPPASATSVQHTAENVARGYVDAGAVGTTAAGGTTNPLQAAPVANSGNSTRPDLSLVLFAPDAVTGADVAGFVYDEAVNPAVTAGGHAIFNSAGAQAFGPGPVNLGSPANAVCARSAESNAAVQCLFADNTLSNATFVGGNVRGGTVTDVDSSTANAADEEGTAPSAGPSATQGRTDGPDLLNVAINTGTSPFGNPTYSATFFFDENTSNVAVLAAPDSAAGGNSVGTGANVSVFALHLYLADGNRLDCASLSGGLGAAQDSATLAARTDRMQITCTGFTVAGQASGAAFGAGAAATPAQVRDSVVGAVAYGAVDDAAGADTSPTGAAIASGSGGTPAT